MKTHPSLIATLTLATLCAGCVGTGPNTQQGAVGGAALGALAGAIIGNNSRGHDAVGGAVLGSIAGAIAGGTLGNSVDHQRGTIYYSEAQATTDVVVTSPPPPPPPPREVVVVQPEPDTIWIGGYWSYGPRGVYAWVPGHWERPPARYRTYVAPHWAQRGHSYVYVQGYWH